MIAPQELALPPRAVRVQEGYARVRNAWAVVAILFGLLFLAQVLRVNAQSQRLASNGRTVEGTVTDHLLSVGSTRNYYLTIDYPAGGTMRTQKFEVASGPYFRYPLSSAIPVVVDPENPRNASPLDYTHDEANRHGALWGLAWLVVVALVGRLFWLDAKSARLQRHRLERWKLGTLQIDRIEPRLERFSDPTLVGSYVNDDGRTVPVFGFPIRHKIDRAVPHPILYGPHPGEMCLLSAITKVERDSSPPHS